MDVLVRARAWQEFIAAQECVPVVDRIREVLRYEMFFALWDEAYGYRASARARYLQFLQHYPALTPEDRLSRGCVLAKVMEQGFS